MTTSVKPDLSWVSSFGNNTWDWPRAITLGPDGSIYVAGDTGGPLGGETFAGGYKDAFIAKFNVQGKLLWTRLIGSSGSDSANAVVSANDGSIYVAGNVGGDVGVERGKGGSDFFIAKYGAEGTKIWLKILGTTGFDYAESLAIGSDGSLYIAGTSPEQSDSAAFLRKYDTNGNFLWGKFVSTSGFDSGVKVVIGPDGSNYFLAYANSQAALYKHKADGSFEWSTSIAVGVAPQDLSISKDGFVYIAGRASTSVDSLVNSGYTDIYIAKLNSQGSKIWSRLFGTAGQDYASAVTVGIDGSIYVSGSTDGGLGGELVTLGSGGDAFIAKYAPDGSREWTKLFGTSGSETASALTINSKGLLFATGYSDGSLFGNTNNGGLDAYVAQLDVSVLYSVTASADSVTEGDSAVFTVSTKGVAAGTKLTYQITTGSGLILRYLDTSDIVGGQLTGTVLIGADGNGQISVPVRADGIAEGDEILLISVSSVSARTIVKDAVGQESFDFSAVNNSVEEGSSATFTLTTANVPSGTTVYYTISGVTASDVVGGSLTGTTVVGANGKASISVPIAADLTTEGAETLTLTLQGKSASVTINDTSITPTVTDFRDVTALQDSSGHFLFTGNATEAEIMQQFGWKQATGLKAFETVDHPAGVTLHKFYYPPTNSFYYATDDQAKAVKAAFTGWVYQGATDMKVFTEAQLKSGVAPKESVPIYQMWVNGTGHVYTTDTTLVDTLMGQDINTDLLTANNVATSKGTYNGVVFWGDPVGNNTSGSLSSTTSSSTEYRFVTALQDKEGHFLFTANQTEADIMQQFGWSVAAGVKGFESADTASGVTLHKFYYPPTNSFYYATDDQAKAVKASFTGWDYQGATDLKVYTNTSYAAGKAPTGSVPIYQMWVNGKGHVYTTDTVLVDQLMGQDINTNVLTANNVATANGTYNGVVFWGDPTTKTPVVPVDTTPPTVSSIQITGVDSNNVAKSGALVQGNRVKVVLTMSEATAVIGTPSFTIDVGGSTKTAQYASGSGSNALTFYYAVESGDLDSTGGITTLANALTLPSGSSIKDSAGNNATLTTASIATGTNAVSIDAVAPTVRSYSPTPGATNVAIGSNFVFTFSEAIKKGTGAILLLDARGSVVESFNVLTSSRLTWASNTLTIDPSSDLSINQLYRFEIPAGAIDDEAGNDYAGTSTYTITTVGEAGPPPGF